MRILLPVIILSLFISCSQQLEELQTPPKENEKKLINLTLDVNAQDLEDDFNSKSRVLGELGQMRVIIEAWTENEAATGTLEKVLALRRELWHSFSSGTDNKLNISLRLFPGEYDFLMWCDYGSEFYKAESLNAVNIVLDENGDYASDLLETGQSLRAAYAARTLNLPILDDGMSINLMAQSPFAVIQAKQAAVLPSGSLPIVASFGEDYKLYDVYDVRSSVPSHSEQALKKPIKVKYSNTFAGKELILTDYLFVKEEGTEIIFSCQVAGFNLDVANTQILKPNTLTIFHSNFLDNN